MPEGIARIAAERGLLERFTLTVESGPIGGIPAGGLELRRLACIRRRSSTSRRSSISTTAAGWISPPSAPPRSTPRATSTSRKFGPRLAGVGGFVNITPDGQDASCSAARSPPAAWRSPSSDGRLRDRPAKAASASSSSAVEQLSFSAERSRQIGQEVLYVTERAVFRLGRRDAGTDRGRPGHRPGKRRSAADAVRAGHPVGQADARPCFRATRRIDPWPKSASSPPGARRKDGSTARWPRWAAVDLAVAAGKAALGDVDPEQIDRVILGNVLGAGLGMNVARQVALELGMPVDRPAMTVNMMCASGMQAVILAVQSILAGESRAVLCGGTESMSGARTCSIGREAATAWATARWWTSCCATGWSTRRPASTWP